MLYPTSGQLMINVQSFCQILKFLTIAMNPTVAGMGHTFSNLSRKIQNHYACATNRPAEWSLKTICRERLQSAWMNQKFVLTD